MRAGDEAQLGIEADPPTGRITHHLHRFVEAERIVLQFDVGRRPVHVDLAVPLVEDLYARRLTCLFAIFIWV